MWAAQYEQQREVPWHPPGSMDAAFADWATPSLPAMTKLCARLAPAADPDDLVQESLVRAWLNWHRFDPARGSASAWLLAIAADRARDARRTRVRRSRVVDDAAALPERSVEPTGADIDLERAVGELAERQRLAVDCFYFVGLSVTETAAVMRCSTGTVKSTLSDARERLRMLLGDDHG